MIYIFIGLCVLMLIKKLVLLNTADLTTWKGYLYYTLFLALAVKGVWMMLQECAIPLTYYRYVPDYVPSSQQVYTFLVDVFLLLMLLFLVYVNLQRPRRNSEAIRVLFLGFLSIPCFILPLYMAQYIDFGHSMFNSGIISFVLLGAFGFYVRFLIHFTRNGLFKLPDDKEPYRLEKGRKIIEKGGRHEN